MNAEQSSQTETGRIFEIQRMSTEDGPGIRTTVFFKGCSLKCDWCHNPESISPRPQVQWIDSRCIACRTCLTACPEKALTLTAAGMRIQREICSSCGVCADVCPSTAMEIIGKEWRTAELIKEVLKDRAYFDQSGGGVTLSGGEPGLQVHFAAALLKGLREHGVHTALDTCGLLSQEALERLLPYTVLVLYDLKIMDPDKHRTHTGHSNERILGNLLYTAEFIRRHLYPRELWLRTPVIPTATASEDNIFAIGRFIAEHLGDVVQRWDLCAFNNLCKDKYSRLDRRWAYAEQPLLEKAVMTRLWEAARSSGVEPSRVHWSGATLLEQENATTTAAALSSEKSAPAEYRRS